MQREKFFGEPVEVSTRDRLAAMIELREQRPGATDADGPWRWLTQGENV